jgi:hypothetical protein
MKLTKADFHSKKFLYLAIVFIDYNTNRTSSLRKRLEDQAEKNPKMGIQLQIYELVMDLTLDEWAEIHKSGYLAAKDKIKTEQGKMEFTLETLKAYHKSKK